jgi:hypothetical protein
MPGCLQEIINCLDMPLGEYCLPDMDIPITIHQFLAAWVKFSPSMYHGEYFQQDEDTGAWAVNQEMRALVQTGLELLQAVITDSICLIGEERYPFHIDQEHVLSEKLWTSTTIEELHMADKLLKLQVELTFA